MAINKIKVEIRGRDPDDKVVRLADFLHELQAVRDAFGQLDRLVSRDDKATMYLRIAGLSYASPATVDIEVVPKSGKMDYTGAVVHRYVDGIKQILDGKIPSDFDRRLLQSFRRIGGHTRRHIGEVVYTTGEDTVTVADGLDSLIDAALGPDEYIEGSISGILEFLNIHAGINKFCIYPVAGPDKIDCRFPDSIKAVAISAIDRYVNVAGRLKYKSRDRFPYAIEVNNIEVYPPEDELPTLFDIHGIDPNATGNLSTEEFIREIRSGE